MRRAARIDENQPEIVKAFRAFGATVQHTHMIGQGFPDIVVGWRGFNLLVEIKDGSKPPSARELTTDEGHWQTAWRGQVCKVESVDDVIRLLQSFR